MGFQFVSVARADGVATVTLRRPQELNVLHPPAHYELSALFDELAGEDGLRVVILTGSGKTFCAGYDLKDNLKTGLIDLPPTGFGGLTNREDYPLPLIAAVNGPALGGGFELALACDLIVAAEEASFALPEPKVGWSALSGGLQRLPRTIGIKRAMGVVLTGRTVSAQEGLSLGFVNEVVPGAQLMDAAQSWATQIVQCAPLAIRCNKQVAYGSLNQPDFARMMDIRNYDAAQSMLDSEDALEGKRAFAERRKPVWSGR